MSLENTGFSYLPKCVICAIVFTPFAKSKEHFNSSMFAGHPDFFQFCENVKSDDNDGGASVHQTNNQIKIKQTNASDAFPNVFSLGVSVSQVTKAMKIVLVINPGTA